METIVEINEIPIADEITGKFTGILKDIITTS
jgi:hypothetical protein